MLAGFDVIVHEPDVELIRGVAANSTHLYWANSENVFANQPSIGRSRLDGSEVVKHFIAGFGTDHPVAVAVDATHVYWVTANGKLGRARLDGTGIEAELLKITGQVGDIAVAAGHIYWSWVFGFAGENGIGRANLDGSEPNAKFLLLTEGEKRFGKLAADSNHIYWTLGNFGPNIGRANTDGTGINFDFVTLAPEGELGLAVTAQHLWLSEPFNHGTVSRINLDGTGLVAAYEGAGEWIAADPSERIYASITRGSQPGAVLRSEARVVKEPARGKVAIVGATAGIVHPDPLELRR